MSVQKFAKTGLFTLFTLLLIMLLGCSPEDPNTSTPTPEPTITYDVLLPTETPAQARQLSPAERQAASTAAPVFMTPAPSDVPYDELDELLGIATPTPAGESGEIALSPTPTPPPISPPPRTPIPDTEAPTPEPQTPTPSPSVTPLGGPVAEAIANAMGQLGDDYSIREGVAQTLSESDRQNRGVASGVQGGVRVRVNGVRTLQGDAAFNPGKGMQHVILDLTLINESNQVVPTSSLLSFNLLDDNNRKLGISVGGNLRGGLDGNLEPGKSFSGECGYVAPQTLTRAQLEVQIDLQGRPFYIDVEIPGESAFADVPRQTPYIMPGADNINIGDTAVQNENTACVTGVSIGSGGIYASPPTGSKYVVIDLTIANTSQQNQVISSLISFRLLDGQGQSLAIMYDESTNGSLDGLLEAGQSRSGRLAFECPISLGRAELEIRFNLLGRRDYVLIDIPN